MSELRSLMHGNPVNSITHYPQYHQKWVVKIIPNGRFVPVAKNPMHIILGYHH
jgi:hypothetical protein